MSAPKNKINMLSGREKRTLERNPLHNATEWVAGSLSEQISWIGILII